MLPQGEGNLVVGESESAGASDEVCRHSGEEAAPVRGRRPTRCRCHAGASTTSGDEQPLLLELAVGARHRADGEPQITRDLAQRREPVTRTEPARGDEVRQLAPDLLVRGRPVVWVEGEDEVHRSSAGCVGKVVGCPAGTATRPRNQTSSTSAAGTVATSSQPTGSIHAAWQSIRSSAVPAKKAMPAWLAAMAAP